MKRIGLTGNIGTGKSTIARVFEGIGVKVYHADYRAREILEKPEIVDQIAALFGKSVITRFHQVDRKALASIVFTDKNKLTLLNNLIHPLVEKDFSDWCELQSGSTYIIQEAAILYESGFDRLFDATILVTAPEELCIQRVMARDSLSREMVLDRLKNQWTQDKKMQLAQYILVNDETRLVLPQVLSIHQEISKL